MKKFLIIIFAVVILAVIFAGGRTKTSNFSAGELLLPEIFGKGNANILFVGDMMFDRYIRKVGEERGEDFIFSCKDSNGTSLGDFLKSFDLVVGNLEGPITNNLSISLGSVIESPENYVFTFPSSTAGLLAKNNIKLVNLGNNHINNFGEAGISSTKIFLSEASVNYFGLPSNRESSVDTEEIRGNNISFVSYNEFGNISAEEIIQKIKDQKQNNRVVIVYAHWGEEYVPPPERVKTLARSFALAGADLIVGSHPHIIQESETLRSTNSGQVTYIYYSLGNFIFDQYWSEEVRTGLVLEAKIENGKIEISEHKVSLNRDGRTCLNK